MVVCLRTFDNNPGPIVILVCAPGTDARTYKHTISIKVNAKASVSLRVKQTLFSCAHFGTTEDGFNESCFVVTGSAEPRTSLKRRKRGAFRTIFSCWFCLLWSLVRITGGLSFVRAIDQRDFGAEFDFAMSRTDVPSGIQKARLRFRFASFFRHDLRLIHSRT